VNEQATATFGFDDGGSKTVTVAAEGVTETTTRNIYRRTGQRVDVHVTINPNLLQADNTSAAVLTFNGARHLWQHLPRAPA